MPGFLLEELFKINSELINSKWRSGLPVCQKNMLGAWKYVLG